MRNFEKKVKYLNNLFIYKFRLYEHENQKLKIYFISPDKSHIYMSVDHVMVKDGLYSCEVGELYFDEKKQSPFEDTPTEYFFINNLEHKLFRKYYDTQPSWVNTKIADIVKSYDSKEGIWFFEN
jgi:hypothetical protein